MNELQSLKERNDINCKTYNIDKPNKIYILLYIIKT